MLRKTALLSLALSILCGTLPAAADCPGGRTDCDAADPAMASMQVALVKHVKRAQPAPPFNSEPGDTFLVLPPATGEWVGEDNRFATATETGWTFTVPPDGALAFETETEDAGRSGAIWRWSAWWGNWTLVGSQAVGTMPSQAIPGDTTIGTVDIGQPGDRQRHYVTLSGGTLTIPSADSENVVLIITHKGELPLTITVTGGGTINGETSVLLMQWQTARLNSVLTGAGREWIRW